MSFVSKIFGGGGGGSSDGPPPILRQIATPSFLSEFHDNEVKVTPRQDVLDLISRLKGSTQDTIGQLGGVQAQVQPGFGRLTQATRDIFGQARQRLADARLAATSDLRGNLEKRRILGSSFANDSIARAQAEFDRADQELTAQENAQQAQNFLLELDQTTQLIDKKAQLDLNEIMAEINQMNFISSAGQGIAGGVQSALSANAELQQKLAAQSAENGGSLFGMLLGKALPGIGGLVSSGLSGIGSLLSGGGGTSSPINSDVTSTKFGSLVPVA